LVTGGVGPRQLLEIPKEWLWKLTGLGAHNAISGMKKDLLRRRPTYRLQGTPALAPVFLTLKMGV